MLFFSSGLPCTRGHDAQQTFVAMLPSSKISYNSSLSIHFVNGNLFYLHISIANECNTGHVNGLSPGFIQELLPLDPDQGTVWERGPLERARNQEWS